MTPSPVPVFASSTSHFGQVGAAPKIESDPAFNAKEVPMLYIVEVVMKHENLALDLSQMRTWLDHMKFQAIGFRQIPGADSFRVDFQTEQEATAFAQSFAGQVLNRAAA